MWSINANYVFIPIIKILLQQSVVQQHLLNFPVIRGVNDMVEEWYGRNHPLVSSLDNTDGKICLCAHTHGKLYWQSLAKKNQLQS